MWRELFDDRQKKEIKFSLVYGDEYNHGTDGHNSKKIIAKFANLLDALCEDLELNARIMQVVVKHRIENDGV